MTLGPVQFVLVGLDNDKMKGEVARQLWRASDTGQIRILDALAIQKTRDGDVVSLGATDLSPDQRAQLGALIGGLMGFGATGTREGAEVGATMAAESFAEHDFGLSDEDIESIADSIPAGKTALMVLFEHRWAIPLKEALQDAGGVMLAQGMVRPETLMAFGADLAAAEAQADQIQASQGGQAH